VKVVPQASNCREVEVGGRVYRRKPGGLFDMPDAVANHVIKNEGGQAPSLSGTAKTWTVHRCVNCGFVSYFVWCGRCGGECVREVA
jgi:hypothetical protein